MSIISAAVTLTHDRTRHWDVKTVKWKLCLNKNYRKWILLGFKSFSRMRWQSPLTLYIQNQMRSLWPTQEMIRETETWICSLSRKNLSLAVSNQANRSCTSFQRLIPMTCAKKNLLKLFISGFVSQTLFLFLFCIPPEGWCSAPGFYEVILLANML